MNHKVYQKILIELGEVLQPHAVQRKLGIEYSAPIDLIARKVFYRGYYVYQVRRSYGNSRQTETEGYVSPAQICGELQIQLDTRRKSNTSFTGSIKLSVIVSENNCRYYFIFIKVGG